MTGPLSSAETGLAPGGGGGTSPWRRAAPIVALLALAALVTAAGWLGYRFTYDTALNRQAERGQVQMRLYAQALESELARFDYVPSLLSLDARIEGLLRQPGNPAWSISSTRAARSSRPAISSVPTAISAKT
jgi:two-component system C4-dicarboxylate transport sensor histidine kinase DctB